MVISIMCLMIPLLVAFGGQIYLGASALISLNEITSEVSNCSLYMSFPLFTTL